MSPPPPRRRSPSPECGWGRGRGRGRSSPPAASHDRRLVVRSRGRSAPRLDLSLAFLLGQTPPRRHCDAVTVSSPPVYYGPPPGPNLLQSRLLSDTPPPWIAAPLPQAAAPPPQAHPPQAAAPHAAAPPAQAAAPPLPAAPKFTAEDTTALLSSKPSTATSLGGTALVLKSPATPTDQDIPVPHDAQDVMVPQDLVPHDTAGLTIAAPKFTVEDTTALLSSKPSTATSLGDQDIPVPHDARDVMVPEDLVPHDTAGLTIVEDDEVMMSPTSRPPPGTFCLGDEPLMIESFTTLPTGTVGIASSGLSDGIVDEKNLSGRSLTFEEIQEATGDFNVKNAISQYGSSVVAGRHATLGEIAVATFRRSQSEGILRFVDRTKWAHPNIATPVAYCCEKKFHVIYNFPYECSLKEKLLKDDVEIPERLKIALDIAKGLRHLSNVDSLLKLSPLTMDMIWLRANGTAVIADLSGSCGGTSVIEFGTLLMELFSPAPQSVQILAERCNSREVSFDGIVDQLDIVLASL